jgi:hypothetical protein
MNLRAGRAIEDGIERYFANCRTIAEVKRRLDGAHMLSVKHEELVAQPEARMAEMCRFLGVEAPTDYLGACASILFESPAKSRHKVQWSQGLIDSVRRQIEQYDFLHGYSYEC